MGEGINRLNEKINSFKKKYYLNLLIRGSIFTLSAILIYFIIASLLEYNLWLGRSARFLIFASFFALVGWCLFHFLKEPIAWWIYKKGIDKEESAKMIGKFFPAIGDKLLNVIQLASTHQHSALLDAGISQKSIAFKDVSFDTAIDLKENRKYLKYFLVPFLLILVLWVVNQRIFTQSTSRIVKFNQEFSPEAPFDFVIQNENLQAFFNEDFTLSLQLKGSALPTAAYIVSGEQRWKMESQDAGAFSYTFEKVQAGIVLQVEASGFLSDVYTIDLINRPELTQIKATLEFPAYLKINAEQLTNAGNLEIPEGTKVTWQVGTSNASKATILFSAEEGQNEMQLFDNQFFKYSKGFKDPQQYSIILENDRSKNKDQITYSVNVIKDQFPQIVLENLKDSILFSNIYLGGSITDDHGLTALWLNYQITKKGKEIPLAHIVIPIAQNQPQQNFYYQWTLDSLKLEPGDRLSYYFQVWDNDGVNGRKSTRSANYTFNLPAKEELKDQINKSEQTAENKIDQGLQQAKDLRQSIEEAQQKLRGKQTLDWQDKKMLEDLIKQREKLDQAIDALQKENQLLEKKKDTFSEESERIKEKSEQIQKLMNELLDDETKKMFQELEKLLKENSDANQIQKMLDKMDRKEINLEKELERTLELFKQLQYDYKAEQVINDLKDQIEKQEELLSKTEELTNDNKKTKDQDRGKEKNNADGDNQESPQKLAEAQEQLQKDFEQLDKSLKELDKLGEELNKQESTPGEEDKQEVKDAQENSKQELQKNSPKKSQEQQKKSIGKMKEMKEQMESMQNSMEMEIDMQNLESLRQILHGLIKLSFDQESLMKEFSGVQQTDPKYISLSQNQLKLKDDSKVLEDSLLALSKKDAFMGSIVTREVGELNGHIDKAVENIKERRKAVASSEMQFSMTSMNNLALMLNDHYNMMMDMMANAQPGMGKKKKGQPQPMSKMQQMLNQEMEEIRKSGKSGRQLSEEMARMAAEQERIRRALQEMQEKLKENGGQIPGGDLPGKMEQTEYDLVNKQITEQTIRRQKEILTRLLDAEKSMREQDLDEERKGETAKDYSKEIPREFEEYLKLKEKEVELLKTVPPKLFPYYKKEVNEYFKRIGTQE